MKRRWEAEKPARHRADSLPEAPADTRRRRGWLLLVGLIGVVSVAYSVGKLAWRDVKTRQAARETAGEMGEQAAPASTPQQMRERLGAEAREVAQRLVERFPHSVRALGVMAQMHQEFGNTAEAVKCWEACARRDPGGSSAYYVLAACVSVDRGEDERAATLFRKALAGRPSSREARAGLADVLMRLGKTEEAVTLAEQDLTFEPRSLPNLAVLGQAYLQLEEYEKAKDYFQAVAKLAPGYTDAYYGLARACARLGDQEKAAEYQEKFRQLKAAEEKERRAGLRVLPEGDMAAQRLALIYQLAGDVYHDHGRAEEAEEHWLRAAELSAADTQSRQSLLRLYQGQDRVQEALRILAQLREIQPDNPAHCLNLGFANARLGQFEAAEDAFRTASKLAPQSSAGYAARAQLYLRADRKLSEARRLAQTAVKLQPSASNYFLLTVACDQSGDVAGALSAIEQAVRLEPQNAEYRRTLERIRSNK